MKKAAPTIVGAAFSFHGDYCSNDNNTWQRLLSNEANGASPGLVFTACIEDLDEDNIFAPRRADAIVVGSVPCEVAAASNQCTTKQMAYLMASGVEDGDVG